MQRAPRIGPFEVGGQIGRGAMGSVWSGVHRSGSSTRPVAFKFLSGPGAKNPDFQAAFGREVQAVAALDHPHVVDVYDYGRVPASAEWQATTGLPPGTPFLVMEYVTGGTLSDRSGKLAWPQLRDVLLDVLAGLAHAHARRVIHRDLKPANLLVDGAGRVKLADFGLARALDRQATRLDREKVLGTPNYIAPEQVAAAWRDLGAWTDLYALGCVGWTLATGRPPFKHRQGSGQVLYAQVHEAPPPLASKVAVPDGFERWLRRLLAKAPRARFGVAADAAAALMALDGKGHTTLGSSDGSDPGAAAKAQLRRAGLGLFGLRTVPLVGRTAERERLWSELQEVRRQGGCRVALLQGPAGTGTSRLAAWLCERAHESGGAEIVRGTHAATPGAQDGLGSAVATRLRCRSMERDDLYERLVQQLAHEPDVPTDEAAALTEMISPAPEGVETAVRFSNSTERYELVGRFLARLARERPVIFWLDDAPLGPDTLSFVDYVLSTWPRGGPPLLLLLTAESEVLAERPGAADLLARLRRHEQTTFVPLDGLDETDSAVLVSRLLGLRGELVARVQRRSGGNPMFAIQLVDELVQRRQLVPGPHGFRLVDPSVRLALPADLRAAWSGRIERFLDSRDPADARALEVAAALGLELDGGEWESVCRIDGTTPRPDLIGELVDRGLARWEEGTDRWSFGHGMVREALESRARAAARWHRANDVCAAALTGRDGLHDRERMGLHLVAAGRPEKGLEPLMDAAWRRGGRGDYAQAAFLVAERERALELAGIARSDPRWAQGWLASAYLRRVQGDIEGARKYLRWADEALDRDASPETAANLAMERARVAWLDSDVEANVGALTEAVRLFTDRGLLASALVARGITHLRLGHLTEGEADIRAAAKVVDAERHPSAAAYVEVGRAHAAMHGSRPDEAAEAVRRGLAIARPAGLRFRVAMFLAMNGEVLRARGELDAAKDAYGQALAMHRALGTGEVALMRSNLALTLIQQGHIDQAEPMLEASLAETPRGSFDFLRLVVLVNLLPCAVERGDWAAWETRLAEADELGLRRRFEIDFADVLTLAAERAEAAGEHARAADVWELAAHQWKGLGRTAAAATAVAAAARCRSGVEA